tara:strand:+ start:121 stop:756 length:636 start_codon:yes stop_codon:yes gene_type:complete
MAKPISKQAKQYLKDNSVTGKTLHEIAQHRDIREALVFGCGTDDLPIFLSRWYPQVQVTAYDIDNAKILQAAEKAREFSNNGSLTHTSQRPTSQFNVVLVNHVLHHGPEELSEEAISFIKPQGLIGVIDYDMKGYDRNRFFDCWGQILDEKKELAIIGHEEAHRIHTFFGLEECVKLMEEKDIKPVIYEGKITMQGPKLPVTSFYYIGQKD